MDLLHSLDRHLEVGKLPHYFLAQCDLLEMVGGEERRIARQAIQAILSDPLAALVTSPSRPQQIYGEVRPGALVNSFWRTTHPAYEQSWRDLSVLLVRVDEHRHKRYHEQRMKDDRKNWKVSGRSELIVLVDVLNQLKNRVDAYQSWWMCGGTSEWLVEWGSKRVCEWADTWACQSVSQSPTHSV